MPTVSAGSVAEVFCPLAGSVTVTPGTSGAAVVRAKTYKGEPLIAQTRITSAQAFTVEAGALLYVEAERAAATYTEPSTSAAVQALVSGAGNTYVRWCIPGKETSGTQFKDVSGRGNHGTIDANNSGPFATDNRISTVVNATAGGVSLAQSAGDMSFTADSCILAFMMTNEDPASSEIVASWGAQTGNFAGFYFSHRSSAAGVGRIVCNRGNGTLVSGSDSTAKFSNAGGTRETHALLALDGPTGSVYLYRDGVLAASNVGLMTGASAFTATASTTGPRLGGAAGSSPTVAGIFRGWQGYVFTGSSLPLNIGRIAAMLAENPSVPLRDYEFQFTA